MKPGRSRLGRAFLCGFGLFGSMGFLLVLYALLLVPFTPGIRNLKQMKVQRPTVVLSADGGVLHRFQERNREWVPLESVSPHVVEALVATEDHRFYDHHGVDFFRLLSSMGHTLTGDRQGGSTITMQLARNMYPRRIGQANSITRKLKEVITAFKIEYAYEKDEVLEAYLNTVPFLYNVYGIELAARTYFRKPARDLDVAEAATLVGMLKATSYYNPVRHPERAAHRRNVVMSQMVKRGVLDADAYATLKDRPVRTNFQRQVLPMSRAPHFTDYVRAWLEDWADDHGYNLLTAGLTVHTTLDLRLQDLAEAAVARQGQALQDVADVEWSGAQNPLRSHSPHDYGKHRRNARAFSYFWSQKSDVVDDFIRSTGRYRGRVAAGGEAGAVLAELRGSGVFMDSLRSARTHLEAGFVAIDPRTGHVKAWVGSRSYARSQYDHVAVARRQPGSTFKPFVYAAALEAGYTPDDVLPDRAVEIDLGNNQVWRPVNAGGFSNEDVTLRAALAQSKNSITAQLIEDVGPRTTARLAERMGVNRSELSPVPSLALGTSEVTLLEMVSAYTTIANGGVYRPPVAVTRIEDAEGNVVAEFEPEATRALSERSALALTDMMRGVIDGGTGQRIRSVFGVRADVAGKTGTTQDNADGWFLMMHPHLVAGSWVGFDDPRVTFRSDYWGQGAHNALYVVGDFYRHALRQGRIDPRPTFGPVPEFEQERPFFARVGSWLGDAFDDLGNRFSRDDVRRARFKPEPAPEPQRDVRAERRDDRSAGADRGVEIDVDIEDFARDLGRVLRGVDRALEGRNDEVGQAYREHVEQYLRDAERFLQEQRAQQSRSLRKVRDLDRREVERQVQNALDRYADDLSPRQRAQIREFLRDLEGALR